MAIIARCNNTVLIEDGDRLGLAEQGGNWTAVAIFVTALLTFLGLVMGSLMVSIHGLDGLPLLGLAVVAGAALYVTIRLHRRLRAAPPPPPWLIFDRSTRTILHGNGAQLTTFARAKLARTFQLGSSSRALSLRHPGGSLVLARGNPFAGSVDAIEQALSRALTS